MVICNVEVMLLKMFRVVCLPVGARIRFMLGKNDKNA